MKESKPLLIFIYPKSSSFIKNDITILQKKYRVVTQYLPWSKAHLLPVNLLRQCYFLLKNSRKSEVILMSFTGYFSLLPVLLGILSKKKTAIILNGTECVSFPKYQYGSLRKPILRFFIKYSLKLSSKLFPVDGSLLQQTHTFDTKISQKKQGILHFFPKLQTPIQVIPNGFNQHFWDFKERSHYTASFITVASASLQKTLDFKGIDLIIELAKVTPKATFTIVGASTSLQKSIQTPSNVTWYPFLEKEALKTAYQQHSFYLQLSINEGFGCALAEAMLCGCIPIVSDTGALPNVTQNIGYTVPKRTLTTLQNTIERAMALNTAAYQQKSKAAREVIVQRFTHFHREKLLLQEIDAL